MRLLFFGTPGAAIPALRRLLDGPHTVAAVVARPDRPRGRGRRPEPPPTAALARGRGLLVLQPEDINAPGSVAALRAFGADAAVVVAFGPFIGKAARQATRLGCFNLHFSLLPKYRGAAPVAHAILDGEPFSGVTVFRLVREVDAGPVLAAESTPIGPEETAGELEARLAELGADLLARVLDDLAAGRAKEVEQDHSRATLAPKLAKEDGAIRWTAPARAVHARVRAMQPWPRAYAFLRRGDRPPLRVTVDAVRPSEERHDAAPGTVLRAGGDDLVVATGAGAVLLLRLQPDGKKIMSARDFINGHAVRAGDRFCDAP